MLQSRCIEFKAAFLVPMMRTTCSMFSQGHAPALHYNGVAHY
jgi:hypothetical protein